MRHQEIPLVKLETHLRENSQHPSEYVEGESIQCESILENAIRGIHVEHLVLTNKNTIVDLSKDGHKSIYLFIKGTGDVIAEKTRYKIAAETIFLPNAVEKITITPAKDDTLHYLKISCKLSAQDHIDLQKLPADNIRNIYYSKFSDCPSYSEAIKSPNTVSRTILSNEYIPRVAMGTVQTIGPDKVAAHEHPMLEQLFLGLSKNKCIVYADDDYVEFPEYSILHIPLGSSHSVSVDKGETMYYVWMDFFLDKNGEEWLKTHKTDTD